MDVLAALLDGPRAQGAFLLRSVMTPPWSLRIEDGAPLTLVTIVRGSAWIGRASGDVHLDVGDTAVVVGPEPYTVADRPATPPQIVIGPGQVCRLPDGTHAELDLGVRTWGNDADGSTAMLTGTYDGDGEVSARLLRALPPVAVVRRADGDSPVAGLLEQELARDRPGQAAVLDRLLDLLLVTTLRTWFARADEPPAWYRAQADPVVGPVLRLLHDAPDEAWSVARLAARAGVSRAALARRFTDLVGEPPMAYLTEWRLALAADLLRSGDATLASVARRVGYGSAFALSAAFKRERGISPREYRGGTGPVLAG